MVEIGKIVKAQGIKGEVRVMPYGDDPDSFLYLKEIYINEKLYKIEQARCHKSFAIIKLCDDRTTAETFIGKIISIPESSLRPLDEDEFYIRDIKGLLVETTSGTALGIITDVIKTGANDVYVVTPDIGKSFMIPAIKDMVLKISLKEKKIIVKLIDGLTELVIR